MHATAVLAGAVGVDPGHLLLTNGGAEAIALVAAELGGRVVEPEFGLHPRRGGALWRSNPHSPSGLLAATDEIADVWDEAFFPLATGKWTRGDGRAVVGSLTKLLACPGLRLGYVLGEPDLVARCRARQPQWAVSGVAAAALPDLLETVDLPGWSAGVARLRRALTDLLTSFGLGVRPSNANWVLVDTRRRTRGAGAARRRGPRLLQLRAAGCDTRRGALGAGPRAPCRRARLGRPPVRRAMSWQRPVPLVGDVSSAQERGGRRHTRLGLRRSGSGRVLRGGTRSARHPALPPRRPRARRAGAHTLRRPCCPVGGPLPAVALRGGARPGNPRIGPR